MVKENSPGKKKKLYKLIGKKEILNRILKKFLRAVLGYNLECTSMSNAVLGYNLGCIYTCLMSLCWIYPL